MSPQRIRRSLSLLGMIGGLAIAGTGEAGVASAAAEVFSFETSPGIVRTNVPLSALDVDATTGLVYGVTDEPGEPSRLVAVDPGPADSSPITPFGTVDVVDSVTLEAGFDPFQIDVSRDGRTIVLASQNDTQVYDRSTLEIVPTASLATFRIVASPDRPDRFLAYGIRGQGLVVDGQRVIDLSETTDPSNANALVELERPITWGADGESVIGVVDGRLARVIVAETPILADVGPDPGIRSAELTVQGDRLLYGSVLIDPISLSPVAEIAGATSGPPSDGTTSFVVRDGRDESAVWRFYDTGDVSAPTHEWSFPFDGGVGDWATLPDGRLVVVETAGNPPRYLTVVDPERLASPYGEFHPVQPSRVLDTRTGVGRDGATGKLGGGTVITVDLAGRSGLPDDGVLAVVLNATVAAPTATSYFSIWPTGVDRPEVSNLNFGPGQTIANSVTVAVGDDGAVRLSNEFGSAHAVLDVVGYYSTEIGEAGARYVPVDARRLLDTRPAAGGSGRVGPGRTVTVPLEGVEIPSESGTNQSAVAVALNVTAVDPTGGGFLTVWPSGSPRPLASSLNFAPSDTRANLVVVGLGAGNRSVDIYNEFGDTHVLVDVFGVYVLPDAPRLDQQGKFLPIEPFRSFDSRVSSPYDPPGRIPENNSIIFRNYFEWTDIWNVTAVNPTADGFLSVLPYDPGDPNLDFPATSNVNFRAGENVANGVYALGDPDTEVYNPFGATHVVIDRFGYLTPRLQRPVDQVWPS